MSATNISSSATVSCRVYAQLERRYGRIVRFRGVFPVRSYSRKVLPLPHVLV